MKLYLDYYLVYKNSFRPDIKQAFFIDGNSTCKNSYTPSKFMVNFPTPYNIENSPILLYIFYMVNSDIKLAMNILLWLANSFISTVKLPFTLVLHSATDVHMKLFYEEIVEPLLKSEYCQMLTNEDMDEKSLSKLLDEKVIYRFHNVTLPTILNAPAKDFSNRLIHKNTYKLNNKVITTVASSIITTTTKYIPLVSKDVPSLLINIESSLEKVCTKLNVSSDYYSIVNLIENDLENFTSILSKIDLVTFFSSYPLKYSDGNNDRNGLLDGDTDILRVFYASIEAKDSVLFQALETKEPKLYHTLMDDFKKNRVDRKNLIEYFTALFGTEIYKTSRALISDIKELSSTKEPFENVLTFNNNGRVYYRL